MSTTRLGVLWEGQLVGHIEDPKVDNFDLYGQWVPSDAEIAKQFIARVEDEGEAFVVIEGDGPPLSGTVEIEPDEEIEVKIRP